MCVPVPMLKLVYSWFAKDYFCICCHVSIKDPSFRWLVNQICCLSSIWVGRQPWIVHCCAVAKPSWCSECYNVAIWSQSETWISEMYSTPAFHTWMEGFFHTLISPKKGHCYHARYRRDVAAPKKRGIVARKKFCASWARPSIICPGTTNVCYLHLSVRKEAFGLRTAISV